MGLFDYLPNGTIDRWVKDKVLLTPETTQCAIPRGIFAAKEGGSGRRGDSGGMLRMIAYGSESNFAYPPRPADPKAVWEPDWAVRVRVKSSTMAMLGEETGSSGARRARGSRRQVPSDNAPRRLRQSQEGSAAAAPAAPSSPSITDVLNPLGNTGQCAERTVRTLSGPCAAGVISLRRGAPGLKCQHQALFENRKTRALEPRG
jgi:hypothetical protein